MARKRDLAGDYRKEAPVRLSVGPVLAETDAVAIKVAAVFSRGYARDYLDGRWLAVDGRELYEVQKAAGVLDKAALRAELTARLSVAWGQVDGNDGAEIVGVPEQLIALFSKRRAQVEAVAARLAGEKKRSWAGR